MKETNRDAAVGVFDSGVGGLTVVGEIMRQLPDEHIVYFGDTARVPYGSKSKETITRYAEQIIRFLLTQNVKAIVIACNTASSYAMESVRDEFNIPIIGVIDPGARTAVRTTRNRRVGVIGTEGTISSRVYSQSIAQIDPTINVIGRSCPLFCPLVEEGWIDDPITKEIACRYLLPLKESSIDTLILGCTHYPHLRPILQQIMGNDVNLVNPAFETARELSELLQERDLLRPGDGTEALQHFFVSDQASKFTAFADSILPGEIGKAVKINIEDY